MRVVSLAPGLTEICCAVGAGAELVGVDEHSDVPSDVVAALPRVGTLGEPDVDAIAALEPDLVLAFDLVPGRPSPDDHLDGSGLPVHRLGAESLAGIYELFADVAELLGHHRSGRKAVAALEEGVEEVVRRLTPLEPRPRAYVELWPNPPLALGRRSWMHELLRIAGAENAFEDRGEPNVEVDADTVAGRDPDVMLVTWGNLGTRLDPVFDREDGWQSVEAIRRRRVASAASDALKRPGPRLARGLEVLATALRTQWPAASPDLLA